MKLTGALVDTGEVVFFDAGGWGGGGGGSPADGPLGGACWPAGICPPDGMLLGVAATDPPDPEGALDWTFEAG